MSQYCLSFSCLLTVVAAVAGDAPRNERSDGNPRTAYLSVPDHQDLLDWFPLDSPATIDAVFDAFRDRLQVKRVWWRGGQAEVWGKECFYRLDNRVYQLIWKWWKHLHYEAVHVNRIAVDAAHRRGMEIWLTMNLFDNGSSADVGFADFPYALELNIRLAHPQCAPLNRFGTWRQGGVIEMCYPEVRKALVEMYCKHVVEGGYDGIAFMTYCENYSLRYDNEFGFNQPIVDEFKRRHGVDIRSEAHDPEARNKLRGEYLTQFFRELHTALAKHGKKIAVMTDGKRVDVPQLWNDIKVRTAGDIHFDLETWDREGIVDEVCLSSTNTPETIRKALALCKTSKLKISAFRTRGQLPAGMQRIMFMVQEAETGFDYENFIGQPDEAIPPQPATALQGDDVYAKRRLLLATAKNKQAVPVPELIAATKDQDVLVRRAALRALGASGASAAIPAVRAALGDPENSVRVQAVLTLAQLNDPECVEQLMQVAEREEISWQLVYRAIPTALKTLREKDQLGADAQKPIVARIAHPKSGAREAALYSLLAVGAAKTEATQQALLSVLNDESRPIKELAIANLRQTFGLSPAVMAGLQKLADDKEPILQMRSRVALAQIKNRSSSNEERSAGLRDLQTLFAEYGDGCGRPDADWGWRVVGNAMLEFGDDGLAALHALMKKTDDRQLAIRAWRCVYLRQEGKKYLTTTASADAAAHTHYPFPSDLLTAPAVLRAPASGSSSESSE